MKAISITLGSFKELGKIELGVTDKDLNQHTFEINERIVEALKEEIKLYQGLGIVNRK